MRAQYREYRVEWAQAAPKIVEATSRANAIERALNTTILPYYMTNMTRTEKRKQIVSCKLKNK